MPGLLIVFMPSIPTDHVAANSDPVGISLVKELVKNSAGNHGLLIIVSVVPTARHPHILSGAYINQFARAQPFV